MKHWYNFIYYGILFLNNIMLFTIMPARVKRLAGMVSGVCIP
jgi:hypothetical protein